MIDRTSKFLLTVIVLLLLALLVRPMLIPVPAQAQANNASASTQMIVSNDAVYLLQNGKLSIYSVETPISKKMLSQLGLGANDPVTLRRVATIDVNKP